MPESRLALNLWGITLNAEGTIAVYSAVAIVVILALTYTLRRH